jgi:SNF2 family DNA or RNA helicase
LPKKHERIEICKPTKEQADIYAGFVEELRQQKTNNTSLGAGFLNLLLQMRQVANHPLLYRRHYDDVKVMKMAEELCRKVDDFWLKSNINLMNITFRKKPMNENELTIWPKIWLFSLILLCIYYAKSLTRHWVHFCWMKAWHWNLANSICLINCCQKL